MKLLHLACTLLHSQLAKSFDDFFSLAASKDDASFDYIRQSIRSSIDTDGLSRLSELMPSLSKVVRIDDDGNRTGASHLNVTATDKMGSGRQRLQNLFHLLVKALCVGSAPTLIVLEDLQFADDLVLRVIDSFIETKECPSATLTTTESVRGGLLLVSSYREDEVTSDNTIMEQIERVEKAGDNVNVTKLVIEGLSLRDLNQLLSSNLCLPMRYTKSFSDLIYRKTQGSPIYVKEILQSLIDNHILFFSVRRRRWIWDGDVISIQSMSNGVAGLITARLKLLSDHVLTAMKLMSCIGSEVNASTMSVFNVDIVRYLDEALSKGLLERAGSIYEFCHEMVNQAVYDLIPDSQKEALHKDIGMMFIKHDPVRGEYFSLAMNQINRCQNSLSQQEKADFAAHNLTAGNYAILASSYQQASSYFKAGISLLEKNHWRSQYTLSLQLHEKLAIASFMEDHVDIMTECLTKVMANATSFDDTIEARILMAQYQGSSAQHSEVISTCLETLALLGEDLPSEINLADLTTQLKTTRTQMKDLSTESFFSMPKMADSTKVYAMKFMSIMCNYALISKPLLFALLR